MIFSSHLGPKKCDENHRYWEATNQTFKVKFHAIPFNEVFGLLEIVLPSNSTSLSSQLIYGGGNLEDRLHMNKSD